MQKELIIIAIVLVAIYLYWQNQQNNLNIQAKSKEPTENSQIPELKNQVHHYQKLYQARVEKDLANEKKISEISQQRDKWKDDYEQQNNSLITYLQGQKVTNFTELTEKVQGQEQKNRGFRNCPS